MGGLISGKAIRHSLLAIRRLPLATRHSLFAAVFGSAGALPSHFPVSLVPCPTIVSGHDWELAVLGSSGLVNWLSFSIKP